MDELNRELTELIEAQRLNFDLERDDRITEIFEELKKLRNQE